MKKDTNHSVAAQPHEQPSSALQNEMCLASAAIVLNNSSGSRNKDEALDQVLLLLNHANVACQIFRVAKGSEMPAVARQVADTDHQMVIAIGGDGTINTVAQAIAGKPKTLGIIPMGTFNYFARNLGIPVDSGEAAQVILQGHARAVSIGQVNGRIFLNNAGLGLYPTLLHARETDQRKMGRHRFTALLSGFRSLVRRHPYLKIHLYASKEHLNEENDLTLRHTPLVYISLNKFQLEHFHIPTAECVDAGKLSIIVTHPVGRLGLLNLGIQTFMGWLGEEDSLDLICLPELWIKARHPQLRVAIDGDVCQLQSPLHFQVIPNALCVLVPGDQEGVRDGAPG